MTDGAIGSMPANPAASMIRRLKRRPDFLAAAKGQRFHTDRMTAQARLRTPGEMRDGSPAEGCHLGFTVTKRVGHAPERNRIKRRLRRAVEAAADAGASLQADVVVIARRPALDAPFATLVEDLRRAFGVLAKPPGPKSAGSKSAGHKSPGRSRERPGDAPSAGLDRTDATAARPPLPETTTPHGSTDG